MPSTIPRTGTRSTLDPSISTFLTSNPDLHLGSAQDFHHERNHHTRFTGIRGPHGFIPLRILYPSPASSARASASAAALIYLHGGGYTIGTVDEFEQGLRVLAESSAAVVVAVEYRLAPEWRFPDQLDEYDAVIDWLQSGSGGPPRGISPARICGGGDSAGGNMTAAIALRRHDEKKHNLKAQILVYPEARLPFDAPAADENNGGLYLECNGIPGFADRYLPRGVSQQHRYVSPEMQGTEGLRGLPAAAVFTSGFDPSRDVGVEYAGNLEEAGVRVVWRHYEDLTHGWLQMTPWSERALEATRGVGRDLKRLGYE